MKSTKAKKSELDKIKAYRATRCEEIDTYLNGLDSDERLFALWDLLPDFIKLVDGYRMDNPKLTNDVLMCYMIDRHKKAVGEIRDVIASEIW